MRQVLEQVTCPICCNKAFKCILWDRSTKACLVPSFYLAVMVNSVQQNELNGVLTFKCSYSGKSTWRSQLGAFVTVVMTCTDSKTQNSACLVTGQGCNASKYELESIVCSVCSCSSVCSQLFVSFLQCHWVLQHIAQPALNKKGVWPLCCEGRVGARLGHTCLYCCRVSPGLDIC